MPAKSQDEIARALQAGDFVTANALVGVFASEFRAQLSTISDPDEMHTFVRHTILGLKEQLILARVSRSHLLARLEAVTGELSYRPAPRQSHSWQFVG